MKKLLCFLLCSVIIFSSVSLCFASPTSWDTSDQFNLRAIKTLLDSGGGIYNMISAISSTTNTISNNLNTIKGYLFDNGHGVAWWLQAIDSFMNPIFQSIQQIPLDLEKIYLSLGYTTDTNGDGNLEYHSFLYEIKNAIGNNYNTYTHTIGANGDRTITGPTQYLGIAALVTQMNNIQSILSGTYIYNYRQNYNGYNGIQTFTNWTTLQNQTFTPYSMTNGIYNWLNRIQQPVARLAYVMASDERIAAQEAAAANEEAVVDNFIDSSGDGAASPSDIGSVSDLSSGYKQNFGSDASPSGIFDIFNSDHATWFSQETKNQLDTTTSTRLSKGLESETPLLDKQIDDIYNALGVKKP